MKKSLLVLLIVILNSCIPLRIAPKIEDYKVVKGKRFRRSLPKQKAFIFSDPKNANEFFKFIEAKLNKNNEDIDHYTFTIDNEPYSLTFYEAERISKTLNLIPFLIDVNRNTKGKNEVLQDFYTSKRSGYWYIAITVQNNQSADCLKDDFYKKNKVITYLSKVKEEYLLTSNYIETLLKE